MIIKQCKKCGKDFTTYPAILAKGKGIYCSRDCGYKNRAITQTCAICKKEFKTYEHRLKENRGKFCSRKCYIVDWNSRIPGWNKDKPAPWAVGNEWRKGKSNTNSYFKTNKQSEKLNVNWKGDNVGYYGLHNWIKYHLGKPDTCEMCKKTGLTGRKIHWANKYHTYERNKEDWLRLCVSCHSKYDRKHYLRKHKKSN